MRFLKLLVCTLFMLTGAHAADLTKPGAFFRLDSWEGPPMRVFYIEPSAEKLPDAPIVIVMHGVRRNADEYVENWRALAEEYGFAVYAPEFTKDDFPGAGYYNLGGVGSPATAGVPSAYAALEPLFAQLQRRGSVRSGYYLFGHSAGAQFVHRALLFEDLGNLDIAVAANAGWYTLADDQQAWPYGTKGLEPQPDLAAWLRRPLFVMLGDQDTDPQHRSLRRTKEAMAQGPHRYARGYTFLSTARETADALGIKPAWRYEVVPGVAHDNAGMAVAAAALFDEHNRGTSAR